MSQIVPLVLSNTMINPDMSMKFNNEWDTIFTNEIGTIKNYKTQITFHEIKWKELLGNMYDKFDQFKISLAQVHSINQTANAPEDGALVLLVSTGGLQQRRQLDIYLSGLNFVNSSFDVGEKTNKNFAYISEVGDAFNLETNLLENDNFPLHHRRCLVSLPSDEHSLIFNKEPSTSFTISLNYTYNSGYEIFKDDVHSSFLPYVLSV